jgi:hypothetical protein
MATSGVIGQSFTVQQVIDHAFRACRLAPQQIAGEDVDTALEQLNFMLSAWADDGVPLWCQTKYILPLVQGQFQLNVASYFPGVVDILEANLQTCTQFTGVATSSQGVAANAFDNNPLTFCTQTTPGGNIQLQIPSATALTIVGFMPAVSGVLPSLSFQYSLDGVTWVTFWSVTNYAGVAGTFTWWDVSSFGVVPAASFYRVLAGSTTTLNVAELFFGNNPTEIPVARINKDDYWNLPNKTFQSRPVQYWCDRQVNGPTMWLWPAPGAAFVFQQITVLAHRQIMNVLTMAENLEIPQRGFDAVWASLGERLRMLVPTVDKKETMDLPAWADRCRRLFWGEERDDSPVMLQVDLSPYTR